MNEKIEELPKENTTKKTVVIPASGPKMGALVTGTIVKITGAVAFVNFGSRNEGYIELTEFADGDVVKEGDTVTAEVVSTRGGVQLSYKKAQHHQKLEIIPREQCEMYQHQTPALNMQSVVPPYTEFCRY